MKIYKYPNKTTSPTLNDARYVENPTPPPDYIEERFGIIPDIGNSDMIDKTVEYADWDKETELLQVIFTNELSAEDKTKLDTIVTNNS